MGIDDVIKAIATLGFPISACIGVGWYMMRQQASRDERVNMQAAQDREDAKKREERMSQKVDAMESFQRTTLVGMQTTQAAALVQNTTAMQKNTEMLATVAQKLDRVACLTQQKN